MKYGDLSSIVQLGVGLHIGTAVLQLYGELGIAPLERRISRIRRLFRVPDEAERPSPELEEELNWVESRYELFKIEFFREYRWCVVANTVVAFALAALLVVIAIFADQEVSNGHEWFVVFAIAASYLPAICIFGSLWTDAQRRVKPLEAKADSVEKRALEHS
ncbi:MULTISPECIES: hypothetical protein [unclassified Bradyrhizobium]|uniref:hypothetical protein n=1 Tax=unclassified Bradyrhizobium TaxID=2631580 RepID=UPI001FF98245|nr:MULTISPECIES: hypothetical protein [unclassified Bradyrhizobium]MCK1304151.1 hypothetical protein [Bradyrhizobium sp. 45]MCK1315854.1 hypothetical protein [Bradyrhizobium sp. 23]MCK1439906.1 hypothetical protein [Bradyrhizobium sp. 15]MCK1504658.1 hypothetical protein [Bradyrhizobium sp. 18]MCK1571376.1 hypothetical protein [Bradyrhizobium sp. 174]